MLFYHTLLIVDIGDLLRHVFLMEGVRVGRKFGLKIGIIHLRWALNLGMRDIDQETIFEGFATEEDWEIVATTICKREAGFDTFTDGNHRQLDTITHRNVTSGITHALHGEIVNCQLLAGIEGARVGKKAKFKLILGIDKDIARPDRRRVGTGVNLRRDILNTSDCNEGVAADNG